MVEVFDELLIRAAPPPINIDEIRYSAWSDSTPLHYFRSDNYVVVLCGVSSSEGETSTGSDESDDASEASTSRRNSISSVGSMDEDMGLPSNDNERFAVPTVMRLQQEEDEELNSKGYSAEKKAFILAQRKKQRKREKRRRKEEENAKTRIAQVDLSALALSSSIIRGNGRRKSMMGK